MKPCKCKQEKCCKSWKYCINRKGEECWFYVIDYVLSKDNKKEEEED